MTALIKTIFGFTFGWAIARIASLVARLHGGPSFQQTSNRRNFTRNAVLGASLLNLGVLGAGFLRFFWPNKTGAFGSDIVVDKADVPPVNGVPYRYAPGKFYLVHNEDGVMAFYWKCPHLGCTVPWIEGEQLFRCPCHGSMFDYNGELVGGPAPRSMDQMETAVVDGNIVVSTGKLRPARSDYDASQATKF
jgi:cytochrome b6-f complex iron-sulfur subunit